MPRGVVVFLVGIGAAVERRADVIRPDGGLSEIPPLLLLLRGAATQLLFHDLLKVQPVLWMLSQQSSDLVTTGGAELLPGKEGDDLVPAAGPGESLSAGTDEQCEKQK
jgi:hypothetical protein